MIYAINYSDMESNCFCKLNSYVVFFVHKTSIVQMINSYLIFNDLYNKLFG